MSTKYYTDGNVLRRAAIAVASSCRVIRCFLLGHRMGDSPPCGYKCRVCGKYVGARDFHYGGRGYRLKE